MGLQFPSDFQLRPAFSMGTVEEVQGGQALVRFGGSLAGSYDGPRLFQAEIAECTQWMDLHHVQLLPYPDEPPSGLHLFSDLGVIELKDQQPWALNHLADAPDKWHDEHRRVGRRQGKILKLYLSLANSLCPPLLVEQHMRLEKIAAALKVAWPGPEVESIDWLVATEEEPEDWQPVPKLAKRLGAFGSMVDVPPDDVMLKDLHGLRVCLQVAHSEGAAYQRFLFNDGAPVALRLERSGLAKLEASPGAMPGIVLFTVFAYKVFF